MVFGLPTPSWHTCGPSPGGTLPISTIIGPTVTLDLVQKCCVVIKYYIFRAINGKYRSKIPPEVADGSHGGLGRGQGAANGLEAG